MIKLGIIPIGIIAGLFIIPDDLFHDNHKQGTHYMKKTILACSLGLMALALTACSGEEKTASAVPGATETCNKYFSEVDALMKKASENEAAKAQLEPMMKQYDDAKKQIAAMPKDQQDAACKAGSEALAQVKQAMGI
ncbi:hypothetical protein GCM10009131_13510 [Morganella psychrotolerans]